MALLVARSTEVKGKFTGGAIRELGSSTGPEAANTRPALFRTDHPAAVALLWELEDLLTLTHRTRAAWSSLDQAAKASKHAGLNAAVQGCSVQVEREIAWIETQLKNRAPQALLVPV